MRVLLVYPEMPDTFYAMKHYLHVLGKKGSYPPLGLLTIASLLPDAWEKKLVDLNVQELSASDLDWADYVMLSAMNVQEDSVREIMGACQEADVPIIAGGSLFTHEYDRFDEIEYFVLNEAEITLPLFLEDLEKGNPQHIYKTDEFANVEESPLPSFHLADMNQYIYAIVQYSRGCPYMCDFCDVTALFGRRPRVKSPEQIIAELEVIHETTDLPLVLFADDNLIGNKKVLKDELLPKLIEWRKRVKPSFFFATQLTINLADDEEMMDLLIDAGFRHVFVGVETPDEESLKVSQKNQNLRRSLIDNINRIHEKGFIIWGGFIVGFDSDKHDIFERQIKFIQESGIPQPIVNILKAPPGTELYDRMKNEGRLIKRFAFSEGDTNVLPVMDEQVLYEGFIRLTKKIYSPEGCYERFINFNSIYRIPKTKISVPEKRSLKELMAVLRVVFIVALNPTYAKWFWKLMWWGFKNNRKMLDKCFANGVLMYQMHQTFRTIEQDARDNMKMAKERVKKTVA